MSYLVGFRFQVSVHEHRLRDKDIGQGEIVSKLNVLFSRFQVSGHEHRRIDKDIGQGEIVRIWFGLAVCVL